MTPTLQEKLEEIKDQNPRLYNEYKCFDFIAERYREDIASMYHKCSATEMPTILVYPYENDFQDAARFKFGFCEIETVRSLYLDWHDGDPIASRIFDSTISSADTPVLCAWVWSEDAIESEGADIVRQPMHHIGSIPTPFRWAEPSAKEVKSKPTKKPVISEKALEEALLEWLHSYGLKADNQISSGRQRMDLWIPGHCFLELKKSKVSGDDVCQAIDYCVERQKPVILVGNHISEMASRGIEAFNKAVKSEMIVFISWSGIRTYLKGLLSL